MMRQHLPRLAPAFFAFAVPGTVFAQTTDEEICIPCGFFDSLDAIKLSSAPQIYEAIRLDGGPVLAHFLEVGLYLMMGFAVILTFFKGRNLDKEFFSSIGQKAALTLLIAITFLKGGGYDLVHVVTAGLEGLALSVGQVVLATGLGDITFPAGATSGYSQLAFLVQKQVWNVFKVCGAMMNFPGMDMITAGAVMIVRIIAAILLMLPYLFVIGVFVAFLVEAMFKFFVVELLSPLLLLGIPFPPFRPMAMAAFRLLLGASITIIAAAGAMAFSMKTVEVHGGKLIEKIRIADGQSTDIGVMEARKSLAGKSANDACEYQSDDSFLDQGTGGQAGWKSMCVNREPLPLLADRTPAWHASRNAACDEEWKQLVAENAGTSVIAQCQAAQQAYATAEADYQKATEVVKSATRNVFFDDDYLMLFIIGFASILLHLSSKAIASNISGANDGAGPAAAVVMAGKAALGMGMTGASRGLFGEGGLRKSLGNALKSQGSIGETLQKHGLLGAAFSLGGSGKDKGGDPFLPNVGKVGSERFSTGAGGGDQAMMKMMTRQTQTLERIAKALDGGNGRGQRRR
ncbi:membrane hypothetical protein [uncultured Alphaproteobacteria bacterium]|uniref:TrbL/VirB6 plasmid conjugal transfer protein n=1 Tax=uncultured Alphaproteobacteria bacterium TaxID=91750 RepID=A0A212JMU8_9PROT|nr:membrane hypothetical protein [uncultured Alphaproteobacteria bacterium]